MAAFFTVGAAPALAQTSQWITFRAAGVPPTPLQMRRATARGVQPRGVPGDRLDGRLTRPVNAGDMGTGAAVVLLHGCDGQRPYQRAWADLIGSWGHTVLLVDSYARRDVAETCTDADRMGFIDMVYDAYGAHDYLTRNGLAAPDRIAVVGWSVGGSRVLALLNEIGIQRHFPQRFAAGIAFYPSCITASGPFVAPLLILAAAEDDWTPARRCDVLAKRRRQDAVPVALTVFPDALHFFDNPEHGPRYYHARADNRHKSPARGATFGYDPTAHEQARTRIRAFLQRHLGPTR